MTWNLELKTYDVGCDDRGPIGVVCVCSSHFGEDLSGRSRKGYRQSSCIGDFDAGQAIGVAIVEVSERTIPSRF